MTKEEIEAAIERYEKDPTESVPAVNHNTVAASAMPMVLAAQQMMQYPKRKLPTYVRMFVMVSSIVGAATLLGFIWDYILRSGFFPWMVRAIFTRTMFKFHYIMMSRDRPNGY